MQSHTLKQSAQKVHTSTAQISNSPTPPHTTTTHHYLIIPHRLLQYYYPHTDNILFLSASKNFSIDYKRTILLQQILVLKHYKFFEFSRQNFKKSILGAKYQDHLISQIPELQTSILSKYQLTSIKFFPWAQFPPVSFAASSSSGVCTPPSAVASCQPSSTSTHSPTAP